jgi:carbamoyl-phosphate synthase small subunit
VIVIDCGVKYNILRNLVNLGCHVVVVPAKTTAEEILAMQPDGLLLSNGPGDPAGVPYVVETVKQLINQSSTNNYKLPIMGICLGHQMLGLAFGGKTYKLKFGHHGGNHPVKDLRTGKVAITVQNHGFCVRMEENPEAAVAHVYTKYCMVGNEDIEITHINLNDGTCEGMRHKKLPVFSVQFHPEASPGPHDAQYLFGEFVDLMRRKD